MPRKVEFIGGRRVDAAPATVADAWRAAVALLGVVLPDEPSARYAVATAQHETDFAVNEVDTEESGFVSRGIFQLSDEEIDEAHEHLLAAHGVDVATLVAQANLCDLHDASRVLAALVEKRLRAVCDAANVDWKAPTADAWAYVAIAHNQGLAAATKTIALHGLDWTAYQRRNPQLGKALVYYGDCITGGASWGSVAT